jgi:hypothetical protein
MASILPRRARVTNATEWASQSATQDQVNRPRHRGGLCRTSAHGAAK